MKPLFFFARIQLTWFIVTAFSIAAWAIFMGNRGWGFVLPAALIGQVIVAVGTFSHIRRVALIAEDAPLHSRHRRQIEVHIPASEAFDLVDSAIRELPYVEAVESTRDSLQIYARMRAMDPYGGSKKGRKPALGAEGARHNQVRATVAPREGSSSITLFAEPEGGAWVDWFMVDHGANYENMEAISRAIRRRIAERRKGEEAQARETATEKELTVAKLSLLHAQVEPHFLYNTLASAQVLTRSDPTRADQMLGHLIVYLRHSLPSTDDSLSTLGVELERARAYLEILKIRMGDRLTLQIQVPDALKNVPLPPMMLQTLAENAIKHGLEPIPRGGNIWIFARDGGDKVSVIVADDGRGFSEDGGGTGVGLKNVRERLRLIYGDAASFSIVANFPNGVAATIMVPRTGPANPPIAAQSSNG
jgi:hypothetical protein